ncbi:MAG: hypothetical protein P1U42_07610 [Phycisphaerales bacterium]|nr:hypothetical protein [Phycisphaerales bacterium]
MSADGHDQWHQHTADEGAPQQEHTAQASAKALGMTFIGMTLGVLFVIIVLVVYFNNYMSNYKASINENTEDAAAAWVEKQEIFAKIDAPIEAAIDEVIADYSSN